MNRVTVILSCGLLVAACGGHDRKQQCESWKQQFNRVVAKVMASGPVNNADDAKQAVAQMWEVRSELAAIKIDDDKLKALQRQYVDIAGKKVATMQALKDAAEKGGEAAWDAASKQAAAADEEEDAVTRQVVDYCRP